MKNENGNILPNKIDYFMNTKNWWAPLTFILVISLLGVGMIGFQTYIDAPPMTGFKDENGKILFDQKVIEKGQEVFHKYALMEYGSFFGDGAQRGPDFTAEALHLISGYMNDFYINDFSLKINRPATEFESKQFQEQVKQELKDNKYTKTENLVPLNAAQTYALTMLKKYYTDIYIDKNEGKGFPPKGYISDRAEVENLASFFYWGAWVCVAERPGTNFSYTHNWPYDPGSGNTPTSPVILWSVLGLLAFVLMCGIVLYYIGQYNQLPNKFFKPPVRDLFTVDRVAGFKPTATQKATYKFFLVAILLFFLQVSSGLVTINDFLNWLGYIGIYITNFPVTISRSWHLMLSLYWISTCWIASSIFILPILSKKEIPGQLKLVNVLFWSLIVLVAGSLTGMVLGPLGLLGEWWRWLGHQGWEFVDFGRVYQVLLMGIFILWAIVVYRGLKPAFVKGETWTLPKWIMYSVIGIPLLFLSGFVAKPETNFVIADFWRWMVIHMWVEAFFEVFITVIVSYLMVLMGLVSRQAAIRVVYFATLLFLGTGLLGISHNFYWNAKPVATMALGSVFSTLQFVPLILLTVEAFRFKNMPKIAVGEVEHQSLGNNFGFNEVFLFLIAVNFWNFFGAGVLGIIINLPIMNYFEHGTYLTVNHAHAALMGVYGNVSIAALLFASKLMIKSNFWNKKLINFSFWSINGGLMLMVLLDLFPAGSIQFKAVVENGLWFGRSRDFVDYGIFNSLTWMRGIGASLFFFGGVIPLTYFIVTRMTRVKDKVTRIEEMDIEQVTKAKPELVLENVI
ncbi:MAG: cbb3-type cytochrome c oxidase subunit I [Saprospiraceae bacterium]|nr:cbb3-type cytochrome c oxidase subunit I [Saprospiraceae bacterium]MBK7812673.1 cbb3-type cytochrome c oxidase subunit I [Saprospiraceae bacterium]MBK9630864.1 cbb3-type cytochrome c oxidase subunit I [Saprospiraceae bacterium]